MHEAFDGQWYCVGPSHRIERKRPTAVWLHGVKLALWRQSDGNVVAIDDRCPHLGASLTVRGRRTEGDDVVCPYHAMRFNGEGRCVHIEGKPRDGRIPKTLQSRSWAVREYADWVFVRWAESASEGLEFEPPGELALAPTNAATHWSVRTWECNFTRAVENSIDALHFWGVHAKVLPFVRYAEEDLTSEVDGNYVRLQTHRDGKPTDVRIALHYPNVWAQWTEGSQYTSIAFVPRDAEHTDVWLRTQLCAPFGLRRARGRVMHAAFAFALWQDQALTESQTPLLADDARKDAMIGYDVPVANFRKLRRRLRGQTALPQVETRESYTRDLAPAGPARRAR